MALNSTGLTQVSNVANNRNSAPTRAVVSAADKVKLEKQTEKEFKALMPRMIKIISRFSRLQGEVPNIVINALGTGLVAPIFIKYNFLSKTDEDTRTYSAWRQPVSAVLAVITQAGMIIPFNHLITKMNNKGEFSDPKYNTTAFPDPKYIEEQLKKEGCKLTGKELEALAKQRHNDNIDNLIKTLREKGTIEYTMFDGKNNTTHTVPEEELRGVLTSVAKKMEQEVDTTIKRYKTEKPEHKISRGEYLRNSHEQVRTILSEIEEQIKAGKKHSEIKKGLKTKLAKLKANNAHEELQSILEQLSSQLDNTRLSDKANHIKGKCDKFCNCKSLDEVKTIVNNDLATRIKTLEEKQKAIQELIKEIEAKKPINIKALEKIIASKLPDNQLAYDVIQKHISNIKANIKCQNQFIGIAVGVAMLPLTCCLLNYLYPRFMDAFFPHLSNKKKPQNNDTFVKVNGTIPMEVPDDKKGGKL